MLAHRRHVLHLESMLEDCSLTRSASQWYTTPSAGHRLTRSVSQSVSQSVSDLHPCLHLDLPKDYFGDRLPRLPVLLARQITEKIKVVEAGTTGTTTSSTTTSGGAQSSARKESDGWHADAGDSANSANNSADFVGGMDRISRMSRLASKKAELAATQEKVRDLRRKVAEAEAAVDSERRR